MNRWILRPKTHREAKIRLFCFPYAGSSAMITYKFLVDSLPTEVEVCPVEFPGRGIRMAEKLIDSLSPIIEEVGEAIREYLDIPFIFLGHSMGAIVAFELTHYLKALNLNLPIKEYLSAHRAPSINKDGKIMHTLNNEDFIGELIKMDGISNDILNNKELLELLLPIIKNDYKVCETYKYFDKEKLDIPFQIFGGKDDRDVNYEQLMTWRNFTKKECNVELIDGDHFFIVKNKELFLDKFLSFINDDIKILVHD